MKISLLCAGCLVACAAQLHAGRLTIVEEGKPRAAIVVAAKEPHAAKGAAQIQKYVEKITGAKLPIVIEGEAVEHPISILVGHTAAATKLGVKVPAGFNPAIRPEAFEEEGFVLKTSGQNIVVGGNSDGPYKGTVYAAYDFLEQLGCRFYFPGDWGEVIPEQKTLVVPDLNVES
jgi:hypothetical protein